MRSDVEFRAEDGTLLRGYLHTPERKPVASIVMAHGLSGVKEQIDHYAARFAASGFVVLVYDHRGFGSSEGIPSVKIDADLQLKDWRDAITFLTWRRETDPEQKVGIWGSSFAGGLAMILGACDDRIQCVVSHRINRSRRVQMPLCDAYIPKDVLTTEVEQKLVARVSEILVGHEMRRIADLMENPGDIEAMRKRASAISWLFVHRTDSYVAGMPMNAPLYRFIVNVPEGQIDELFVPAINRDIFQAIVDAEDGRWPSLERRLWVTVHEIYDGRWGSAGRQLHLKQIIDFVSPGWGEYAERRFAETQREHAIALVELAKTPASQA